MIVSVQMIEHHDKNIFRQVRIPDTTDIRDILDSTFQYGQNDVCNVPGLYSVSVGDIVDHGGEKYLILSVGFHKFDQYEYEYYLLITPDQRYAASFFIYDNVSQSSPAG